MLPAAVDSNTPSHTSSSTFTIPLTSIRIWAAWLVCLNSEISLIAWALDVVETAARRKTDVLGVATVFFGLGDRLSLIWLRESAEKLSVEGRWHAHARGNLRDEVYSHHRKLAGRVLEAFPDSKNPVGKWIDAHAADVERLTHMMNDMHNLPAMDYATVSVAVRALDQLLDATQ